MNVRDEPWCLSSNLETILTCSVMFSMKTRSVQRGALGAAAWDASMMGGPLEATCFGDEGSLLAAVSRTKVESAV